MSVYLNTNLLFSVCIHSATLLPFLTQLEVVDLSWNDLVGGSLKALTFHLQHVGKLRVLRLCGCRLTAQDLAAFGKADVRIAYSVELDVIACHFLGNEMH